MVRELALLLEQEVVQVSVLGLVLGWHLAADQAWAMGWVQAPAWAVL